MRQAAIREVGRFAQHTLGNAQQYAPVGGGPYSPNDPAPGTLQNSGLAEEPVIDGESIACRIGFNTVYAARQHEELSWRHSTGQAKYLERALKEASVEKLAERLKAAVNG